MGLTLNGPQSRAFVQALDAAFTSRTSLAMAVWFGLNEKLDSIAGEGSLHEVNFTLVEWANSNGCVEDLLKAVLDEKPNNVPLRNLAHMMGVISLSGDEPSPEREA